MKKIKLAKSYLLLAFHVAATAASFIYTQVHSTMEAENLDDCNASGSVFCNITAHIIPSILDYLLAVLPVLSLVLFCGLRLSGGKFPRKVVLLILGCLFTVVSYDLSNHSFYFDVHLDLVSELCIGAFVWIAAIALVLYLPVLIFLRIRHKKFFPTKAILYAVISALGVTLLCAMGLYFVETFS